MARLLARLPMEISGRRQAKADSSLRLVPDAGQGPLKGWHELQHAVDPPFRLEQIDSACSCKPFMHSGSRQSSSCSAQSERAHAYMRNDDAEKPVTWMRTVTLIVLNHLTG